MFVLVPFITFSYTSNFSFSLSANVIEILHFRSQIILQSRQENSSFYRVILSLREGDILLYHFNFPEKLKWYSIHKEEGATF